MSLEMGALGVDSSPLSVDARDEPLQSLLRLQQSLDDSFAVGTVVRADLHRYPGGSLRALAGTRTGATSARLSAEVRSRTFLMMSDMICFRS